MNENNRKVLILTDWRVAKKIKFMSEREWGKTRRCIQQKKNIFYQNSIAPLKALKENSLNCYETLKLEQQKNPLEDMNFFQLKIYCMFHIPSILHYRRINCVMHCKSSCEIKLLFNFSWKFKIKFYDLECHFKSFLIV